MLLIILMPLLEECYLLDCLIILFGSNFLSRHNFECHNYDNIDISHKNKLDSSVICSLVFSIFLIIHFF